MGKGVTALCLFRLNLRVQRFCGKVNARALTVAIARAEENRTQSHRQLLGFPQTHEISFRQFEKKSVNKISDTSKIAILRSMPLFAADAAWVEMVNAGEL